MQIKLLSVPYSKTVNLPPVTYTVPGTQSWVPATTPAAVGVQTMTQPVAAPVAGAAGCCGAVSAAPMGSPLGGGGLANPLAANVAGGGQLSPAQSSLLRQYLIAVANRPERASSAASSVDDDTVGGGNAVDEEATSAGSTSGGVDGSDDAGDGGSTDDGGGSSSGGGLGDLFKNLDLSGIISGIAGAIPKAGSSTPTSAATSTTDAVESKAKTLASDSKERASNPQKLSDTELDTKVQAQQQLWIDLYNEPDKAKAEAIVGKININRGQIGDSHDATLPDDWKTVSSGSSTTPPASANAAPKIAAGAWTKNGTGEHVFTPTGGTALTLGDQQKAYEAKNNVIIPADTLPST